MDQNGAAYHCTPLVVANQLGWTLLAPAAFAAVWDGGSGPQAVTLVNPHGAPVGSHFGSGIVTVTLPYLVRTPKGVATWVKAVPNLTRHGVQALEGLVETDWHDGSFTINLQLTQPHAPVGWDAGEPLVQLVPWPRRWLQTGRCDVITEGPVWDRQWTAGERWMADRAALIAGERRPQVRDGAYRRGERHDGAPGPGPRPTRLALIGPQPAPEAF
jgi:hypothetical protein